MTTTVLNEKIGEIENKFSNHDTYISSQEFNKLTQKT